MTETWLPMPIPEYADLYEISDHGRVRRGEKVLKPLVKGGYGLLGVNLYGDGCKKSVRIHRMVAIAFIGPCPREKNEVAHGDGDPTNNHVSNLRWATRKENIQDNILHGTQQCKLTKELILEIRARYQRETISHRDLAREYNVCHTSIGKIVRGKNWSHVTS